MQVYGRLPFEKALKEGFTIDVEKARVDKGEKGFHALS